MERIRVAVLFGGNSSEYEVSLQSAYSVINALSPEKYEVFLVGITRDGEWLRYKGATAHIEDGTWIDDTENLIAVTLSLSPQVRGLVELRNGAFDVVPIDVVFPVLHGKNGEDGTVQGFCELAGLPVVGCGTAASALCMDKDRAHKLVSLAGIKVPRSVCFESVPDDRKFELKTHDLKLPVFVKPVKAGSSLGITRVTDRESMQEAAIAAFMFDDAVIIEESVEGFEIGCAVLGNGTLTVGEIDEIELSSGFFDFLEKYSLKTSKIHIPARISDEARSLAQNTAKIIYKTLGCRGFARVDMFLTPTCEIYFNEVNTIPGFTSHSRYPMMMRGAGLEFPALVDELIALALE